MDSYQFSEETDTPSDNEGGVATKKDPLVGTVLDGRFEIEEVLGSGGAGVVYKAKQLRVNRYVAIKTVSMQLDTNEVIRERFLREINSLCQLNHPNIVTVYDCIFGEDNQPYVVMDYLKGLSLDQLLRREGPLSLEQFARIALQVLSALDHAHKKGIIHRDIKPGNVMLMDDESDIVKVVDFGLAKLSNERSLTNAGELWGSPPYMAPEQANGDPVDTRSDVYGLGAVFYEMLTGKDPFFECSTVYEIIQAHIEQPPPPFLAANPDVKIPPAVQSVIFKSLSKAAEDRYQTVADMQAALVEALANHLDGASRDYLLRFSKRTTSGDNAGLAINEAKFNADELLRAIHEERSERAAPAPMLNPRGTATNLKALGTTAASFNPRSTGTNLTALPRPMQPPQSFQGPRVTGYTETTTDVDAVRSTPETPASPEAFPPSSQVGLSSRVDVNALGARGTSGLVGGNPGAARGTSEVGTGTGLGSSIGPGAGMGAGSAGSAGIGSGTGAQQNVPDSARELSGNQSNAIADESRAGNAKAASNVMSSRFQTEPQSNSALKWIPWAIAACSLMLAISLGVLVLTILSREEVPVVITQPVNPNGSNAASKDDKAKENAAPHTVSTSAHHSKKSKASHSVPHRRTGSGNHTNTHTGSH